MNVGVLGTGMVGRALSAKIAAVGNDVVIGTRDVAGLIERDGEFAGWQRAHPDVKLGTFADAATHAEIAFNATSGTASLSALEMAGRQSLAGKVLVDVANPLDSGALAVVNTDSLGEQVQRALPDTRVVKALNTINANLMVDPGAIADGNHDLFLCGNDPDAKATVSALLSNWFGWKSVVDLGDITSSRGMEMYLPLWLRLMGALGTPMFNIKVVR
jgi:hypothetical protein